MLIGLVGCGPWGGNVLRDLRTLGCDVAVAARHESSRQRARDGGANSIVSSVRELTAILGITGFVVVTETSNHAQAIDALIATGLPIFVEKPLCGDAVDARRIADQGDGQVFVMDKWRYHPGVAVIRQLIMEGALGTVTGIRTRRNQWGSKHDDVDAPWTLMPHDIAIVDELLGAVPELISVRADVHRGKVEGVVATFGTSPWVVVECFARAPRIEREILVFGTTGIAVLPSGSSDHVQVFRSGSLDPDLLEALGELPLLAELREFVEYLRGGKAPRAGVVRAAAHVLIIENVIGLAMA
jgi:predicted dehydrogenase